MAEEYMTESYSAADDVIDALKTLGFDYTDGREEIARCFDEGIFNGNWDYTTEFEDLRDLRLIQEDEYDQSMDEDPDRPDEDDVIAEAGGVYVFFA